jgi:hypothetical protein
MRMTRTDNGVLALTGPAGGPATDGVAYAVDAGRLRVDAFANDLCATLDAGVYRWSVTGGTLTLTVISDPCAARAAVFGGRWAVATP